MMPPDAPGSNRRRSVSVGTKNPASARGFKCFRILLESLKLTSGSPRRTRTADPVINSHLLYRLSYRGILRGAVYFRDAGELRQAQRCTAPHASSASSAFALP
jgi:hypothetical protein